MSRLFFTADNHFWHEKILGFTKRPWFSVEEMNEGMASIWNSTVARGDRVIVLGDFSFNSDVGETSKLLSRLNGQKTLVLGNHDHSNRVEGVVGWQQVSGRKEFNLLDPDTGEKDFVVTDHFPLLSWHKSHYGAYHLHGHCHGNLKLPLPWSEARLMDVGVDSAYEMVGAHRPLEWQEIKWMLRNKKKHMDVDHHVPRP